MKNALPQTAIIAITQRCNSKCTFCKMWECENPVDLNESIIDKLPLSLKEVNITGGEPFLHKKINLLVEKLSGRGCKVIINTNGLVKIPTNSPLLKLKRVGIRFSLDGIREAHDSLRGIPGNYKKVIDQIDNLQSAGFTDLGIVSTFSDANCGELEPLYRLSHMLHIGFTCAIAANSELFYKNRGNVFENPDPFIRSLRKIIRSELFSLKMNNLGKALFMNELAHFAAHPAKYLPCSAGKSFFYLAASGEVFACNMRSLPMGNLAENSFKDLWSSSKSQSVRRSTARCDSPCWTMCNAKQIMKDEPATYLLNFCQPWKASHEKN
jgi:MoaA/NifB/PqqE/SkfB family radical SAM enzyme